MDFLIGNMSILGEQESLYYVVWNVFGFCLGCGLNYRRVGFFENLYVLVGVVFGSGKMIVCGLDFVLFFLCWWVLFSFFFICVIYNVLGFNVIF